MEYFYDKEKMDIVLSNLDTQHQNSEDLIEEIKNIQIKVIKEYTRTMGLVRAYYPLNNSYNRVCDSFSNIFNAVDEFSNKIQLVRKKLGEAASEIEAYSENHGSENMIVSISDLFRLNGNSWFASQKIYLKLLFREKIQEGNYVLEGTKEGTAAFESKTDSISEDGNNNSTTNNFASAGQTTNNSSIKYRQVTPLKSSTNNKNQNTTTETSTKENIKTDSSAEKVMQTENSQKESVSTTQKEELGYLETSPIESSSSKASDEENILSGISAVGGGVAAGVITGGLSSIGSSMGESIQSGIQTGNISYSGSNNISSNLGTYQPSNNSLSDNYSSTKTATSNFENLDTINSTQSNFDDLETLDDSKSEEDNSDEEIIDEKDSKEEDLYTVIPPTTTTTKTSSKSSFGSNVGPIITGVGVAGASGVGVKMMIDKKNEKTTDEDFEDNEDNNSIITDEWQEDNNDLDDTDDKPDYEFPFNDL